MFPLTKGNRLVSRILFKWRNNYSKALLLCSLRIKKTSNKTKGTLVYRYVGSKPTCSRGDRCPRNESTNRFQPNANYRSGGERFSREIEIPPINFKQTFPFIIEAPGRRDGFANFPDDSRLDSTRLETSSVSECPWLVGNGSLRTTSFCALDPLERDRNESCPVSMLVTHK